MLYFGLLTDHVLSQAHFGMVYIYICIRFTFYILYLFNGFLIENSLNNNLWSCWCNRRRIPFWMRRQFINATSFWCINVTILCKFCSLSFLARNLEQFVHTRFTCSQMQNTTNHFMPALISFGTLCWKTTYSKEMERDT